LINLFTILLISLIQCIKERGITMGDEEVSEPEEIEVEEPELQYVTESEDDDMETKDKKKRRSG